MDYAYRILAVDDEPDILRTNRRYLEAQGYQVDTAACASEALEHLKNQNYDAILLDVLLPDRNGFALCEAIRALTSAPILFLSCMDEEEDKIEGLMAGGDDYITKPYSLKELAARVYAQVRRISMKRFAIDHSNQLLLVDDPIIPLPQKAVSYTHLDVYKRQHMKAENKKIVSILSGGNMDVITMASIVQHGLIQRDRVFTVSVLLPDKPGELAKVSTLLAKEQGNVIRLEHNQFISINRNSAVELRITIEAYGTEHKNTIMAALTEAGYRPKLVKSKGTYAD